MSAPRSARFRRGVIRVAISMVSALIMAGVFAGMGDAGAATQRSGSVIVAVDPTTRVADGQSVSIRVASAAGIDIYQIRAHLCSAGAPLRSSFDFGFQGRRCANVALGHGDVEKTVEYGDGVNAGKIDSFKVGAGSVHWVNELGYDQIQACGPGHPCDLAVRVQITDDTLFFTVPLCYGAGCAAAPADPVVLIPTPTSTSTTVHPTSTTIPTSVPAGKPNGGAVAAGSTRARTGGSGPAAHSPVTAAVPKGAHSAASVAGSAKSGLVKSDAAPKSSVASSTPTSTGGGISQNTRVLLAALAGAIGSAWIVSIFLRGRALLVPIVTRKDLAW